MKERNLEIGIFRILYFSKNATYLRWYNLLLSFIMLIFLSISILNKNFSIKINVSPFATVAITGLSFTLALLIATTTNVFEKDELLDIVEVDENEFYILIGPYVYTALIWLFLGLITTIKFINILNSVCLLNQILDIVIVFLFTMGLCNLFDLIITNIQDLIKKIERDINDRNQ
jgi:hypothetical protein